MPTGPRPAPPAGTCKLIYTGLLMTHRWVNTFWLNLTSSAPAQADLDALSLSLANLWGTDLAEYINPGVGLDGTTLVWTPTVGSELVSVNATPHSGASTGTIVRDASACYVLSWHISAYYRGGHPRSYLPGVENENLNNGSDVISALLTNLHVAGLNFLNGVNALTHGAITACQLGTVSFASHNAWRSPPIFRPYVGISASSKIGTQRRRIHSQADSSAMPRPVPPGNTARLTAHVSVNGRDNTTGFWLLVPSGTGATLDYAHELLDAFYTTPAGQLVALMHSGAVLTACSVLIHGADLGVVTREYDGARGPWTGGQAVNVSLGWHWYDGVRGRGTTSVNRLVGVPDDFIDANWRVSTIGYANLIDKQATFFTQMNELPGAALGSTCVLGCVHNLSPGSIDPPSFAPFYGGTASRRVLTVGKRLPHSAAFST